MGEKSLGVRFMVEKPSKIVGGVIGVSQLTPVMIAQKPCIYWLSGLFLTPLTPILLCMAVGFKNKTLKQHTFILFKKKM